MLQQGVQDSANTERGLDHIRCVFPDVLCDGRILDLNQLLSDSSLAVCYTGNVDGEAAIFLQLLGKSLPLLLCRRLDGSLHCFTILLEGGAELLLVEL